MVILRLLPISFVLLFILLQRVDVKVKTRDRLIVRIDFNIIAIIFSEDRIKKKHIGKFSRVLKNLPTIYKALRYLVKKSDTTVVEHNQNPLFVGENDIFKITSQYAICQIIYSFLSINSRSFQFTEKQVYSNEEVSKKSSYFDLLFHFPLFHLINSALVFLYYIVKSKAKEVIKNV